MWSFAGGNKTNYPLSTARILGGSSRYLSDGMSATWSPDGTSVAYSTADGDIDLIRSDGSGARKLASVGGRAYYLSWSPDGVTLRFTSNKDGKLWEISSSGSNLRPVLPSGQPTPYQYAGQWAPDGRFFFLSNDQIWTLEERHRLFRQPSGQPVQLTAGPILWSSFIPGKDGKKIFASGETRRGELVSFDSKSGQFLPFLAGISGEFVVFSKDGKSVAYVSYPDRILWKANRDGSQPVQLTDPPLYPRLLYWSPDGTKILFAAYGEGDNHVKAYIVPSQGGRPQRLLPEDSGPETDAIRSPDGSRIVFASSPEAGRNPKSELRIFDVATRQVTPVSGSAGMYSPRWSPDGRTISAQSSDSLKLKLFYVTTEQWSLLYTGVCAFATWSSDSRFIYFMDYLGGAGIYSISIKGGKPERVADLKVVHYTGLYGLWMGLYPTDAPLIMRDAGSDDIYALTLEEK